MANTLFPTFMTDFKLIYRDKSLRTFLFLPLLILLVVYVGLPYFIEQYPAVNDYLIPILIVCSIETTQLFCFLYAMIFIEEKETKTNTVYGIIPVSLTKMLISRFALPVVLTAVLNFALLMIQPFFELDVINSLIYSFVSALIVPLYAIGVSIFSKNKMQGLVWVKAFNIVVILPIVYLIIDPSWKVIFTIFPTFWLFKSLESIITDQSNFSLSIFIAFVFMVSLLFFAIKLFQRKHYSD